MNRQDLCQALQRLGIDYRTDGENISGVNWIGIDCPGCHDSNKHMGVEINTLRCSCWRCQLKGNLYTILSDYYRVTWGEYKSLFCEQRIEIGDPDSIEDRVRGMLGNQDVQEQAKPQVYQWPRLSFPIEHFADDAVLNRFLKRRRYTLDDCIEHGCRMTRFGKLAHRLLIPVYHHGDMLGLLGRALYDELTPKYWAAGPLNRTLYGIEHIQAGDSVLLVEGVFDQWRCGKGAVASFGKKLSAEQRRLLVRARPSRVFFCWDEDAFWQVEDVARELASLGVSVRKVEMVEKKQDPDLLGREKMLALCRQAIPYME